MTASEASDSRGRLTVAKAMAAVDDIDGQLTVQAVIDKADDIVAAYNDRVNRQIDIINRILQDPDAAATIERLGDEIQNQEIRIQRLQKQLKKAQRATP